MLLIFLAYFATLRETGFLPGSTPVRVVQEVKALFNRQIARRVNKMLLSILRNLRISFDF